MPSNLEKFRKRLLWAQTAKHRLEMTSVGHEENEVTLAASIMKSTMIEHIELEIEFLTDVINEEING